ncbi:221_t:CDS:2, partial [Ambispora gerdemannii]
DIDLCGGRGCEAMSNTGNAGTGDGVGVGGIITNFGNMAGMNVGNGSPISGNGVGVESIITNFGNVAGSGGYISNQQLAF